MTPVPARVLVYADDPGSDPEAVLKAYHAISEDLLGTPGLLGNELLTDTRRPGGHVVVSYWTDLEAFRVWEEGARHRVATSPLRPYQSPDMAAGIYEVTAAYSAAGPVTPS